MGIRIHRIFDEDSLQLRYLLYLKKQKLFFANKISIQTFSLQNLIASSIYRHPISDRFYSFNSHIDKNN
jgi:hypothetical protein